MSAGEFGGLLEAVGQASPERRGDLVRRIRDSFVVNGAKLTADEVTRFDELMTAILDATPLLDRITFAKAVAKSPRLPERIRRRLLADNAMVAAPILEHAPLTDEELIAFIDLESESNCLSIARRAGLSDHISDLLIGAGHPKVLLTLARNVDATLSPSGFEILSDIAIKDEEMDEALSSRPDLPPDIARKLTRALELRTRRRLTEMMERDMNKSRRTFVLR